MNLPVLADSLQSYFTEVNRYPVLTPKEEFEVAERYFKTKSVEDAHRLVTSNLRYVIKIALEYRNYGCRVADLIQEGNIGLMVAVKKFNPHKGFRLITYANWWIKYFIQDFILRTKGIVRRGVRALKKKLFYKNGQNDDVIADDNAFAAAEPHFEDALDLNDLSLDATVSDERTSHLDMLKDNGPGPVEVVARTQEQAIVKREVRDALAVLNDRERLVIENRVMTDEPKSLQDIGDELGLTRERVRQIEGSAMKKLQKRLSLSKADVLMPLPEGA